ncbi:MAG: WD40 repeat domain-containing protein [Bacteroidia bacterium]|nr:WD40 repeat domain-containing protein [Bacteroidia bacterium]
MKLRIRFLILLFFFGITGNLNSQYNFNVIRTLGEMNHEIVSASYSPDGTYIITTGSDSSIIIWNADRRTIYRTITGLRGRPDVAVFSNDNEFVLSGGKDNKVSKWDLGVMPPKIIETFEGYNGPVRSIDISPDGKYMATGSTGGSVKIWDLKSANLIFDLKGPNTNKDINSVVFSPDGKIIASGGADGKVILWNTASGIITGSQPGQKGIYQISYSPDGKLLASCGYDNDIIIWQLPGFTNKIVLKGHKDWVQAIDFSPDSKCLLSGGRDGYIILWDVTSGNILHRSEKRSGIVMNLDFNPVQPDFISSDFKSEELEKWALSGFDETKWKKPAVYTAEGRVPDNTKTVYKQIPAQENTAITNRQAVNTSMIEIFSPVPVQGKVVHDKNIITIVGRVSDPQGINTFLINRNVIKLVEGGVFTYDLSLTKGENQVDIVAINNKGIMNEQKLVVDCTAGDAAVAGEEIPEIIKGRYFALLIGVGEYQDEEISDLDNPVKDAQSLYDVLLSQYSFEKGNIKFLKNPTQKDIFLALEDLGSILSENDNLLIFYAGHGYWDEKGKLGYWLPADASRNSKVNWFPNSLLRDFIGSIQTKHTILIADACFSGAIFKTRAAFTEAPQGVQKLYEIPSRKAMTSGNLQEVPDESVFIKFLVKKLAENKEKYLPSEILFSNLQSSVMNNSPNVPRYGTIQNVGDEGGGDFIFILK